MIELFVTIGLAYLAASIAATAVYALAAWRYKRDKR